ncbi:MAG TPA: DUF3267 domain-containing protein [Thermomicrobiales bacterium]|nr:DUF3267 domain-containing protein [Thermomicrobiales bacterium]
MRGGNDTTTRHTGAAGGYRLCGRLDFATDWRFGTGVLLITPFLGLLLLVALDGLAGWVRPAAAGGPAPVGAPGDIVGGIVAGLLLVPPLHECVHCLALVLCARARPRFGRRGGYLFVAAPGIYLHRRQYLIVSLAPLGLITALGMLLLPGLSAALLPGLLLALTANVVGALGDLAATLWVLRWPAGVRVQALGAVAEVYRPLAATTPRYDRPDALGNRSY